MRDMFSSLLHSRAGKLALSLVLTSSTLIPQASAFSFPSAPAPNLSLDGLGRVAFAGDFDSIQLYQFQGQSERPLGLTGALLSRFPNGAFATINETDADIKAMCAYAPGGTLKGIIFGGNFTSVGSQHTPGGIALINPDNGTVIPLEGLNGSVNALYCDNAGNRVFIGGSFTGGNSTNAIIWSDGWKNMPFSGFNGPVNSIAQASNGNIIFGGQFNGLGDNMTAAAKNNTQVLPIGSATLTAQTSSGTAGLTEPKNIVCKADASTEGPNNTWLLADNAPGFWQATFGFGFEPTKLRLHNTKFEGRGTKTFRYTVLPDGGIMNFSYVDPSSGQTRFCDARCPLPEGNTSAQDFSFVNNVGMNSFRIDISDWYGRGGGLNGIELFQNDIYTYAIQDFNEPKCGGVTTGAITIPTPTNVWQRTPSHDSNSEYLTATLTGDNISPDAASIVFQPDIKQSGNYSVTLFTPGCVGDNTCTTRGRVNITGSMSRSGSRVKPTEIFQTNNFDKYDPIYDGYVDATNGFRPSITLTPSLGQNGPLTLVGQRVRFTLKSASSGNLNGLFEYDSKQLVVQNNFADSVIDAAGASLAPVDQAIVSSVTTADDKTLYVGGNFTGTGGLNNIFAIKDGAKNATALKGNGLNSQVLVTYKNGSALYVGGNFTNTQDNTVNGLNGIALYNNNDWQPLGAGVHGVVLYIVPFSLNVTGTTPEQVLGVSGYFNRVNSFGSNAAFTAENFAVWVPSRNNWLQNLKVNTISLKGKLMARADIPGADPLFAGSVSSFSLGASGAVTLQADPLALLAFPVSVRSQQQQASLRKRALSDDKSSKMTGVSAATFYKENNMNKTILAGHFVATGTDNQNITSLLIIDGKNSDRVTGLGDEINSNSTFTALGVVEGILFAGGSISGTVNNNKVSGILAYDLAKDGYASTQPPGLQGPNATVNAIALRPKSKDVFIGGKFQSAGTLSCPALCIWNTDRNQWNAPGGDIAGEVSSLDWISDTKLLVAGNLTIAQNTTNLVSYDSSSGQFKEFTGAGSLPGVVNAICPASGDASQIWVAGQSRDGSAFLQRFDGTKWNAIDSNLFGQGTIIRGIQVLMLSKDHDKSDILDAGQDLLILGQVNITGFGTASAALFNGTTLIPFLLSTNAQGASGSLSQVFVENPQSFFKSNQKHLALGFVVLIALGIALALTFLLVVAGILLEWYRKKSRGYMPAPTNYPDRMANVDRVPPEHLFGTLQGNRPPAI